MSLEAQILLEARRLGFAAAGIATAAPAETIEVFNRWRAAGRAARMDYLSRHAALRADPRRLAPGVRSIIVVAARYPVNSRPGRGFSSYARGRDYHAVLRAKLQELSVFIERHAVLSVSRICVDSAPILEREWAVRAGLGWRGKQGQIVSEQAGCCLVLGELLVDLALRPTPGVPNRCGACRLCLDACPTGALGADGLVDARKCLAYLTIEHDGEFPDELRPLLGAALFGCDLCTAVCPWNRAGDELVMPELAARPMPTAEACLAMTDKEFQERFRDTCILRSGPARLRRNAAAVLANLP